MSPVNTVQRPGSPVLSGVFLHLIVAANIVLSPDLPRRRSTRAAEQVAVEGTFQTVRALLANLYT